MMVNTSPDKPQAPIICDAEEDVPRSDLHFGEGILSKTELTMLKQQKNIENHAKNQNLARTLLIGLLIFLVMAYVGDVVAGVFGKTAGGSPFSDKLLTILQSVLFTLVGFLYTTARKSGDETD
jgi:hypothetical protein